MLIKEEYSSCNPIQISVYEYKIYIWNDGEMPSELDSTEKLFEKHSSKPYNPRLANVFFKSGMIEAWGRGFDKIKEACAKYDGRLPEYNISTSGIMVLCKACDKYLELLNDEEDMHLGHSNKNQDQDGYDVVMICVTSEKMEIYFCERGAKMFNQNQIYNIFNQQQIQAQLQQMQQQYHNQQIMKVSDCAKKLDDFLKSAEEIDDQYQQLAFAECCAVLGKHMQDKAGIWF